MPRSAWMLAVVALAAALVLSGCGSGGRSAPPPTPRLSHDVGRALAARSDVLAASLERGDACTAAAQAAELRRATLAEVDRGRVPRAFQKELLAAVDDVVDRVPPCVAPPPPQEPLEVVEEQDEEEDHKGRNGGNGNHGKGKGRGKKRGHNGEGNGG